MDLQSLVTWNGLIPEYILEGLWYVQLYDYPDSGEVKVQNAEDDSSLAVGSSITLSSSTLLGSFKKGKSVTVEVKQPDFLDPYLQEITIPQLSLSYTKTEFDMLNFEDKDVFGSTTLTFYDDTEASCLGYFDSWVNAVFDVENNCLRNNWRKQQKKLVAKLIRIYRKAESPLSAFAKASIGGAVSVANGVASLFGVSLKDRLKDVIVLDVAEFDMEGCIPKGIQEITLSDDGGDRATFSVEMELETVKGYYRSTKDKDAGNLIEYNNS